jgi:hypothetical protein
MRRFPTTSSKRPAAKIQMFGGFGTYNKQCLNCISHATTCRLVLASLKPIDGLASSAQSPSCAPLGAAHIAAGKVNLTYGRPLLITPACPPTTSYYPLQRLAHFSTCETKKKLTNTSHINIFIFSVCHFF